MWRRVHWGIHTTSPHCNLAKLICGRDTSVSFLTGFWKGTYLPGSACLYQGVSSSEYKVSKYVTVAKINVHLSLGGTPASADALGCLQLSGLNQIPVTSVIARYIKSLATSKFN